MQFEDLDLNYDILDALDDMNFVECTPIQEHAIPPILEGRDIIGVAQTGTGKTAAYLLPILSQLRDGGFPDDAINCVIMAPTRELAQQIDQAMQGFAYYLDGISSVAIYGGNDGIRYEQEKRGLAQGASVIICTPGRLISHLSLGNVDLSHTSFFVLDEADRMLDMGFSEDIMQIAKFLPAERQTIMFSATMPDKIVELAKTILTDPVEVKLAVSKPADGIRQSAFICYEAQKLRIVEQLLRPKQPQQPPQTPSSLPLKGEGGHLLVAEDADGSEQLDPKQVSTPLPVREGQGGGSVPGSRIIIFVGSKMKVKDVAIALKRKGFNAEAMHSDLLQEQRDDVMYRFKVGQLDILVATDIVARGIDIDDIQLVINYDVPRDEEDYVHRIGRTARAGKEGRSVTLVSEKDQPLFRDIERFLEKEVPKEPVPAELGEAPAYTGRASAGRSGNRDRGRNRGGKRGARGDKRDKRRNRGGKHKDTPSASIPSTPSTSSAPAAPSATAPSPSTSPAVSALGGSPAEESGPSLETAPAKKKRTHRGGRKHKRTPASPPVPPSSPSPHPAPVPDASPSGSHPSATPTNN